IRDNIAFHNTYGVFGNGGSFGTAALDKYASAWSFSGNAIIGLPKDMSANQYPQKNYFPSSMDEVGFVNTASGDYRLSRTSRFKNKASDGTDIGCNFDALPTAIADPQSESRN